MRSQGDAGLEAVYRDCRGELLRFLVARTGNVADAEDVLQEMWLRLRAPLAGPVASPRSYLYRIAQNLVVDRARARQRRIRREDGWATAQSPGAPVGAEPADARLNAEDAMLDREEAAALDSAFRNLPEGAQRVFRLHKLEGLSHAQVADQLGISKSGVEKHMAVAMRHFRRALLD